MIDAGVGPLPGLLSARATTGLRVVAVVAAVAFVAGLLVAPERVWPNALLSTVLLAGLGLAGGLFLALHHVTGARWGATILSVPAAMTRALLPSAVGVVLLVFGATTLYAWADPSLVTGDPILEGRRAWMNVPFVFGRAVVCVAAWIAVSWMLVGAVRRAPAGSALAVGDRRVRLSVVFLLVFGLTFSIACFDWLMSLDRYWFSTVYAVYNATGLFLSGLAALTLLAIASGRRGALGAPLAPDVLHDLGKLLFAFSMFWGYIWFCQYMLIWYANMPEETSWYVLRHGGAWEPIAIANVLLNWLVPFLVLLPRGAKRNATTLVRVSVILLVGRWVDLYQMILAPTAGSDPVLGPWEVLLPLGAVAVFLLVVLRGGVGLRRGAAGGERDAE